MSRITVPHSTTTSVERWLMANSGIKRARCRPPPTCWRCSTTKQPGQIAQSWADQCQFSHSQASGLSENIYYTTRENFSSTETLKRAFNFWCDEVINIGIPDNLVVDGNNFGRIGHFTQESTQDYSQALGKNYFLSLDDAIFRGVC
uniref:SCP domain-containing protein n=1 Tax=Globodera pallida TaxID=36090 RepID=A0A183CJQ8_GLOPA